MAVQCVLNGADVTSIVQEGSVTHQHNRPSFATIRVPSDQTTADEKSRLKVVLDGSLDFHGACVDLEDQGDRDEAFTSFTFADPTLIFEYRPVRDGPASGDAGDFSKPSVVERQKFAPQIVQEILQQSMDGSNPADGEGPMGITLGTFATGGANLSGAPTDWPMTIAQLIALLVDTGELDVVNTAIDVGGNMGQVSAYNGDYGQNLSSTVKFHWQTGLFNAVGVRRRIDVRDVMNKLWIYGGPQKSTKDDPKGDQRWPFNVTGTDTGLPPARRAQVLALRSQSQLDYFVRMQIRIFDGREAVALRELYRRWWIYESFLRLKPKTTVHITPEPGIKPTFRTGDQIAVAAGPKLRGGFAGAQRVMEYTYRFDVDGVVQLGEPVGMPGFTGSMSAPVQTTPDTEGLVPE